MSTIIPTPAPTTPGFARAVLAAKPTSGAASRCACPTTTSKPSRDGFGENWPISYSDIAPYYDKVDLYLGISGVKKICRICPTASSSAPRN